ncbi:hypothetical protein DRN41_07955 [Thermococci archaeon]|nr:MAG: hypothetical protein DRN41_07955 [Thermococci archaeon]
MATGTVRTALSRMQREGKIEKNQRGLYDMLQCM